MPLAPHTWYNIGGPARWFVRPRTVEELQEAASRCAENDIPIYVLGLGANLLVSDAGVNGAVFRLDQEYWRRVKFEENVVEVGAGVDMQKLVLRTVRQGLAGIECLAGIPGTVGGGIRMNAGGKFGDIGAVVTRVRSWISRGLLFERTQGRPGLRLPHAPTSRARSSSARRSSSKRKTPSGSCSRTKEIWMYKRNSQPLNTKNAGCIFKNPRGLSAGALIDQAGLKGMRVGGAEVSDEARQLHRRPPRLQGRRCAEARQDHPREGLREERDPPGERSASVELGTMQDGSKPRR